METSLIVRPEDEPKFPPNVDASVYNNLYSYRDVTNLDLSGCTQEQRNRHDLELMRLISEDLAVKGESGASDVLNEIYKHMQELPNVPTKYKILGAIEKLACGLNIIIAPVVTYTSLYAPALSSHDSSSSSSRSRTCCFFSSGNGSRGRSYSYSRSSYSSSSSNRRKSDDDDGIGLLVLVALILLDFVATAAAFYVFYKICKMDREESMYPLAQYKLPCKGSLRVSVPMKGICLILPMLLSASITYFSYQYGALTPPFLVKISDKYITSSNPELCSQILMGTLISAVAYILPALGLLALNDKLISKKPGKIIEIAASGFSKKDKRSALLEFLNGSNSGDVRYEVSRQGDNQEDEDPSYVSFA